MRIILCADSVAPRDPSAVLKPSMLPMKRKHHVITMFAIGEGCVDHLVCKWELLRPLV